MDKNKILKNLKIKNAKDVKIYLYINIPILFSFRIDNQLYLCYILKYKPTKGKFEYILTNINDFNLIQLQEDDISLTNLILQNNSIYFFIKDNKITKDYNLQNYVDYLPKYNFYISKWFNNI